jgi:DNA-directed RNA polymerase beta' subunit
MINNKGIKTATCGYLHRQLTKTLENVLLCEDNTVMQNGIKIIQFQYGQTIDNGDSTRIGSHAAMSISETLTQMTLNTFHYAGDSEMTTSGLPRVRELVLLRSTKGNLLFLNKPPGRVMKQLLIDDVCCSSRSAQRTALGVKN